MEKIYRPKYGIINIETYMIFGLPIVWVIMSIPFLFATGYTLKERILYELVIFFIFGFIEFLFIFSSRITITVRDGGLVWKRMDKTIEVRWDEIKKVEKLWRGYAGICYYIVTKKGRLNVPTTIGNYQDLFKEIKSHIGKGVKWGL